MMTKLRLLLCNPRRYVPLAFRLALRSPLRQLSRLLKRSPFVLQEQMDIHPRSAWHDASFTAQTGGYFVPGDAVRRAVKDLEPWDCVRRDMLVLLLRSINLRRIPGDIAEVGVYRGLTARLLHHYMPDRSLHLFDTFTGFDRRDLDAEKATTGRTDSARHYENTSVRKALKAIGGANEAIRTYAGHFPGSIPPELNTTTFAFVHLDTDLYNPVKAGLEFFYEKMSPGGFIVVHDYNAWPGPRKAVEEFFRDKAEVPVPMPDKNGSVVITKLR